MRHCLLAITLLGLFVLTLASSAAGAGDFSGSAEWRYGEYRAEEDGSKVSDAYHFTQQYSLMYDTKGTFVKGRAGRWDLSLGAEWTSLDGEADGEDTDLQTEKFFFRGDMLLAPGGLPFRLHLYSYDMHRTQLLEDTVLERGGDSTGFASQAILDPHIITDLSNGERVVTGATLLVGIRNGSYLGQYRDLLSTLPRLLVDYKQTSIRNLESFTPQHSRMRDLAFVSLNKKDNWFHYRYSDYVDYLNRNNDYTEKKVIIGTIDPTLQRQWINLTNWIRFSADGTFTKTDRPDTFFPGGGPTSAIPETERFDLNLFATARRSRLETATFTNFQRVREQNRLRKDLEVPFYASGEIDRNTAWRFNFEGSRSYDDIRSGRVMTIDEDIVYAKARVEAFRQARYLVVPTLEAESCTGSVTDGGAVRAGVEVFSNSSYAPRYDLFGAYSLAYFGGSASGGGSAGEEDSSFWEQVLTGRVETSLSGRARTGIEERLLFGSGTLSSEVTSRMSALSMQGLTASTETINSREGDIFRSTTTWFGEYSARNRVRQRVELSYDVIADNGESEDQVILRHRLDYNQRSVWATMSNELIAGGNYGGGSSFGTGIVGGGGGGATRNSFRHASRLRYNPGRSMEGRLDVNYEWRDLEDGATSRWKLDQGYFYNFFTVNGLVRKLADVGEEIAYERLKFSGGDDTASAFTFTLLGNYYPTKIIYMGGKFRYRVIEPENYDEFICDLNAGLNFEKLQVALGYAYGTRTAGSVDPERDEQRWEVKVRKIF